ncbi:MAG TPA: hypothetical protein DDW91_17765 [Shewanella frigidimarina]|nr:hypothetical protein [Shewanella frigidimarina]
MINEDTVAGNSDDVIATLKELTLDDVQRWDFVGDTPANRKLYHDKNLDIVAYVTSNKSEVQFYFNRWSYGGDFAACFSDSLTVLFESHHS